MAAPGGVLLFLTACALALLGAGPVAHARLLRPPPAIAKNVVLISIDGWHSQDLAWYVNHYPESTLANLTKSGKAFMSAEGSLPSDSFPGLANIITGGTPKSHGFYYDVSWSRALYAPGDTKCKGKLGNSFNYDEFIDVDVNSVSGGCESGVYRNGCGINATLLPYKKVKGRCVPWYPHNEIRVNTIFEVASAHGFATAWADKHLAYEWVNGPSGKGVWDLYTPEIASSSFQQTNYSLYDELHIGAVINWINGMNHTGGAWPVGCKGFLVGCNLQGVSGVQKLLGGGYTDAYFTPSALLLSKFQTVDDQLTRVVAALKTRGVYDQTLIIVCAKHGQSPADPTLLQKIKDGHLSSIIAGAMPEGTDFTISDDDSAYIWLQKPEYAENVTAALRAADPSLIGITSALSGRIYAGDDIVKLFGRSPFSDSKVPDIAIQTTKGVIFTGSATKIEEHGGFADDDRHTGLLLAGANLTPDVSFESVETKQIGPTIIAALGLNPHLLQAVAREGTEVLPIF